VPAEGNGDLQTHANQLPLPRLSSAAGHESTHVSGAIASVRPSVTFQYQMKTA